MAIVTVGIDLAKNVFAVHGVSNAWLREQGLLSVKDLWCKTQGYTGKRKKASSSEPTC